MYTLPAAPPPVASSEALRLAALHSAGPAAAEDVGAVAADAVAAPPDVVAAAVAEPDSLAEDDGVALLPVVAPWVWPWLGPQPLSSSATAAAAVTEVITSL
jgi:hypothetical protein